MPGLPEEIPLTVIQTHIDEACPRHRDRSPVALALRDFLKAAGIEFMRVIAGPGSIWIHTRQGAPARYLIPDDARKLVELHRAGCRVRPGGEYTLTAMHR